MPANGNGVFTIDGVDLRLFVTKLTREAAVTDSDNAGRVQSGRMHRDIIGTFYNYTIEVDPVRSHRADYDTFYSIITAPTDYHTVTFPFGQETITFEAYSSTAKDDVKIDIGTSGQINKWSGLSVKFTAMEPQRR